MLVIADSSPLIALVNIDQIGVLPRLFKQIIIPPAVAAELSACARHRACVPFRGNVSPQLINFHRTLHVGRRVPPTREIRPEGTMCIAKGFHLMATAHRGPIAPRAPRLPKVISGPIFAICPHFRAVSPMITGLLAAHFCSYCESVIKTQFGADCNVACGGAGAGA